MFNISFNTIVLKKFILYSLLPIFCISAIWNSYYTIISFIATNLTVRESFYYTNDINTKGTHWGGEKYRLATRQYKLDLAKLNYASVLNGFKYVNNVDLTKSNYNKEYQLINYLYQISKLPNSYKNRTALYVPKNLKVYWDLSCDSHMPPFVAPAITNMAMVEGMPFRKKKSCYTHFSDHGYNTYYLRGKTARWMKMDKDKICDLANQNGFKRIIEISENKEGVIISIVHECKTEQ